MSDIFGSTGIHLGPFFIRYYGLLIVGGLLVAAALAAWLAKRDGRDPDHIWGGLTWALIPGIIGARLWFVLFPSEASGLEFGWFLHHDFFDLESGPLAIWSGGLGIFGAVIGGLLGIYLYARRNKMLGEIWQWLDIAAICLPLGQAIGRWGNFINQELYGSVTTLPWGITIERNFRVEPYTNMAQYPPGTLFHPIFLYESLWNALAVVILIYLWLNLRNRFRKGDFLLLYIISYATIRFLLEFLRVDIATVGGLNINQVTTGIGGLAALALLLWRHRPAAPRHAFYSGDAPQKRREKQMEQVTTADEQ